MLEKKIKKLVVMEKYCGLPLTGDDPGELRPSNEVSGNCFDDDVVDDDGDFNALELAFFDFDPCLHSIAAF